jgi:hypothetical protein
MDSFRVVGLFFNGLAVTLAKPIRQTENKDALKWLAKTL